MSVQQKYIVLQSLSQFCPKATCCGTVFTLLSHFIEVYYQLENYHDYCSMWYAE